jgi:hypothetical protein
MPSRGIGWRRLRVALAIVAFVACLTPLRARASWAAEPAAPASQAVCIGQWQDTVTPGIALTPSTATFTSNGPTGEITCVGSVKGHAVTGPGTLAEQGTVQGTCASGSGSGLLAITLPTDGGPVSLIIPAIFTFVGGVGLRSSPPTFPGGFIFVPTRGDCVATPVTAIAIVLHGTLMT